MAYLRPDSDKPDAPNPVSRPAPALKNQSAKKRKKANPNRTLNPRQVSLEKAFGSKYKAQTGRDLRSNPGLLRALLESNVADLAAARDVMASDKVKIEHIPPIKDQDFANQFVIQLRENGMTPLSIAMLGGKLSKNGRARDAGFLDAAQRQVDAFEALSRKQGPGREVEKGLENDAIAEAVLGGLGGGLVAGGVKAAGGAAARKAAGGFLGADALEGGAAALRYTVPTRGVLKHIVPNRPSVARPLADYAARGATQRIAAGSGILAAAPASRKVAEKASEVAEAIRGGAAKIEVDPSELNLDAQAVAAGKEPPKPKNLEGLRNGPGRLGLSPSIRRRLLHQARVNGWPVPDSVNDTELVAKAYKVNRTVEQRLTAGLVENAGNLAFVPAFAGALYDASGRSLGGEGAKPFVEIAEGMANATANAAQHPIDNPLFAASILSAGVKTAGKGSAKVLGVKEAPLKFKVGEVKGKPYEWQYGTAKANTLTRPAALLGQKILNSPKAKGLQDTIMAKQGGRAAETMVARATARGGQSTHQLSKALNKLGKKEQILAVWSHLTGSSAANQAAYYQRLYDSALRRQTGYKNSKGVDVPPRKVNEKNLDALKAKAAEWKQLADVEARMSPKTRSRVEAFGREAENVEASNQQILSEFGMSPEVMKQRLWQQALAQHPDLKARVDEEFKNSRLDWDTLGLIPKKADARELVGAQIRGEMEAAGVGPKMWTPHTPVDSGPSTFITASNPFLTSGKDRLPTGRFERNTGETLRSGQIDERPSLTVAAAAKPAQVKSMVDDMERFLEKRAVPLDVPGDRGLRVDSDRFVYVRASKDGKLSRSAVMRRGQDQARLLEEAGLANEGAINDLMSSIFDVVQPKDGRIPKGKYYVIPRAVQQQVVNNARTDAIRRGLAPGLRKVAQTSTSLMINTLPRTVVNNLFGGIPMSTMGGAGPLAHARYLRDPEIRALTPPELQGRGTAGAQTAKLSAKEGKAILRPWRSHTQRMRSYNVAVEDFPRGTLAVKNLLKEAKDVQYGNKIVAGMHRVNAETKNIAKGLYDTHPERYERAVQNTVDWVGDLGHLSKLDPAMQIAVPFWRWTKHILKSTLYTMPKKYPGRAILLQAMGEVGREYQREHGIWPSWIQGAIDLGDDIPLLGGVPGKVNATLNSSGAWPYSTQTQVVAPAFDNAGIDPLAPLGNVSPIVSLAPALLGANFERMDKLKDSEGRPIEVGTPEWRRLVLAKFLEFAPTPYSRSGQENTSLPWDTQYKDNGLPRRPNDALNIFLRGIGVPITPVLTGGPDLAKQGKKAFKRAKTSFANMPLEEKQAMANAWKQNSDGSYSTIIDLGHGH